MLTSLFSLFYITGECYRFLYWGWAGFSDWDKFFTGSQQGITLSVKRDPKGQVKLGGIVGGGGGGGGVGSRSMHPGKFWNCRLPNIWHIWQGGKLLNVWALNELTENELFLRIKLNCIKDILGQWNIQSNCAHVKRKCYYNKIMKYLITCMNMYTIVLYIWIY